MKNIAVIGAGITGLLAAYYLAKKGNKVTVIERFRYPAMQCSYANGGQLSVSNSEVWNTWSNVGKGMQWMFQKDAPLLIRPTFELDKLNWISRFLFHTVVGSYRVNTEETIDLGLKSRKLYQTIIEEEGLEFDFSQCGILHFYKNEKYFSKAKIAKHLYNSSGCDWDILNESELRQLDSALSSINGILGGAYTASDSVGDIHKFCQSLVKVLKQKYNVNFYFETNINWNKGLFNLLEFDKIVVSAGVGSINIAKEIGDSLPIYPVKGYSITINVSPDQMQYVPKISLLDDEKKIVSSTLGNRFRVAGTAELTGENYDITYDRIKPLLDWVHTNFPNINTSNYSSWACLRPMTPNMMPIVRPSRKNKKVIYHTGHGHLGWTLSPATAIQLEQFI